MGFAVLDGAKDIIKVLNLYLRGLPRHGASERPISRPRSGIINVT